MSPTKPTVSAPTLISIGTFLIDAFDTPPRPTFDHTPLPVHPALNRRKPNTPPTPESPTPSSSSHIPSCPPQSINPILSIPTLPSPQAQSRRPQAPLPIGVNTVASSSKGALNTPLATPTGSGSSTPQLPFDQPPPEHPFEHLGGGGLYCLIGARFFLPPTEMKILVDRAEGGADLRDDLEAQVNEFGESMWVWNETKSTRMTHARIRYDGDTRLYHPNVKPPHRKLSDLIATPLQSATYLHISPPFSAEDVSKLQEEIARLTSTSTPGAWEPRLVFEPTPPSCHVGQRTWLESVAPGLHVLSPNHEELLSFYGYSKMVFADPALVTSLEKVMLHLLHQVGVGKGGNGILAVRCGRLGACIGTKRGGLRWFPAYYTGEDERLVKDVTGAGNSWIGGYVAGLSLTDEDPYEACLYGTVAASFVVEQIGLPSISTSKGIELFNGALPEQRIIALKAKWVAAGLL